MHLALFYQGFMNILWSMIYNLSPLSKCIPNWQFFFWKVDLRIALIIGDYKHDSVKVGQIICKLSDWRINLGLNAGHCGSKGLLKVKCLQIVTKTTLFLWNFWQTLIKMSAIVEKVMPTMLQKTNSFTIGIIWNSTSFGPCRLNLANYILLKVEIRL